MRERIPPIIPRINPIIKPPPMKMLISESIRITIPDNVLCIGFRYSITAASIIIMPKIIPTIINVVNILATIGKAPV